MNNKESNAFWEAAVVLYDSEDSDHIYGGALDLLCVGNNYHVPTVRHVLDKNVQRMTSTRSDPLSLSQAYHVLMWADVLHDQADVLHEEKTSRTSFEHLRDKDSF